MNSSGVPPNPYEPTLAAPESHEITPATSPHLGAWMVWCTALLLASFLGFLLIHSPPDRWVAYILSLHLPSLAVLGATLRYRPHCSLLGLAAISVIALAIYLPIASQPGIDLNVLRLICATVYLPAAIGCVMTRLRLKRKGL